MGDNTHPFYAYTVNFWDIYNVFWKFHFDFFLKKCNIEYQKKKATHVFQNFGSVGKGQTNFFFFFLPYERTPFALQTYLQLWTVPIFLLCSMDFNRPKKFI